MKHIAMAMIGFGAGLTARALHNMQPLLAANLFIFAGVW